MKHWTWLFAAALAVTAAMPWGSTAQADETKENETPISMDKVPAPARATMEREAAGAPIINVVQETTNKGQTVYEAHVRQGDKLLGIEVDANGKLVKKETETNEQH
jgi:hypothetical protein